MVMSDSGTPRILEASARPRAGCWVLLQISSLPSLNWALELRGSMGACEIKGYEYAASRTFAPPRNASSRLPSSFSVRCGLFEESSCARLAKPAELCRAPGPSSHFTASFARADCAAHHVSATIATP